MAFDTTVIDDNVELASTETETPEPESTETEQTDSEDVQADAQDATDEVEDSEDGDEAEDNESEAKPEPEKKNRASDRIQQLIAEKKAVEAENARLREQSQQPANKQTANPDGAPVKPNIDDFDIDTQLDDYFAAQAEYEEKLTDWKLDQRLQQRETAKQQEARNAEITDAFSERFKANPKFQEDFQQLATLMQDKPIQADPSELYAGDDLMDLLEHVAADQDLYYELAEMPEKKQYAEFGRIHAAIQAKKGQSKAVRQSKAPPPANHTKANATTKSNPYKGSDDDIMRARGL